MTLRQRLGQLQVTTRGQGFYDITSQLQAWLAAEPVEAGLLTVFLKHTSASLLIQENADPDVLHDLQRFLARLAPEDPTLYRHGIEGPDDMPAHLRTVLTAVQLAIPVVAGRLDLGRWQGVYLCEHRAQRHERQLSLHLLGA